MIRSDVDDLDAVAAGAVLLGAGRLGVGGVCTTVVLLAGRFLVEGLSSRGGAGRAIGEPSRARCLARSASNSSCLTRQCPSAI